MGIRNWFAKKLQADEPQNATVAPATVAPGFVESLDHPDTRTKLQSYAALYSTAYSACEQTKARSFGSLPVAVYRRDGNERIKLPDHPIGALLSGMANECMSGLRLREWASLRRDTFGNAYIFVEWNKGVPVALWPVNSTVRVNFDPANPPGRRISYTVFAGDTYVPAGTYFADEIVNLSTAITKNGVEGESLAALAADEIGLSVDLEKFYANMLANGNHQLGHVEVPDGRMQQEDLDSLHRAIDAKRGINEAGKAPIFGFGAKWIQDQMTMKDASLIEQQTWVLQQVCRHTNVPPWKVYDMAKSNYNNSESARIDYATDTVTPEAADFEKAFIPALHATGEKNLYLKCDLDGLMRGDSASRASYYREMGYLGALTRADVREKEDMNPIDGLEKPLVPVNYGLLEADGTVTVLTSSNGKEPSDGSQTATTDKNEGK